MRRLWYQSYLVIGLIFLVSCAPTLYMKQSFREALELPVVKGTIALNRGETMEIDPILKKEGVQPEKIVLTCLYGRYFITGDNFQYVWMIAPGGKENASFSALKIQDKGKLVSPKFEHQATTNCVTLIWGAGGENRIQIDWSGRVDRRCSDVSAK